MPDRKVLHINTRSGHGGAAHSTRQLHQALKHLPGIASIFVSGREGGDDVIDLGISRWRYYANVLAFRTFGLDGPFNQRHWRALEPLIEATDIVHLHNVHGYYLPHAVLDHLLRKPVVWTLRDYWLVTGRSCYPRPASVPISRLASVWPWGGYDYPVEWLDRFKQRGARLAGLVSRHRPALVAISHDMAERLLNMGIAADHIHVIHNGIFTDTAPPSAEARVEARCQFGWSEDERILLFVAAEIDDPIKGWTVLDKALHRLARPQDWHLVIIGTRAVHNTHLVRTTFLGPLPRSDVMASFRAADLYVNPTLDEAFGRTTLEALGEGADVLCSDIPVLHETAGSAVTFFPVGSPDGLAEKIDDYQSSRSALRVERAARIRQQFSTERTAERYRALYETVLSNQGRPSR